MRYLKLQPFTIGARDFKLAINVIGINRVVWLLISLVVCTSVAKAQVTDAEKSLRGIQRAFISVGVSDEIESFVDTDKYTVEKYIKQHIDLAGLLPISAEDVKSEIGSPGVHLYINEIERTGAEGAYPSNRKLRLSLELRQEVIPLRQKTLRLKVITWSTDYVITLYTGSSIINRKRLVESALEQAVNDFLIAYRKANPESNKNPNTVIKRKP
jgi:hypothetical protein